MKKTITHILITLISVPIIILSFGSIASHAENGEAEDNNTTVRQANQEAQQSGDLRPPIIPRPSTLPGPDPERDPDTRTTLTDEILPNLAVNLVGFVTMAALLWLIISGVRFATAYGNEEKIENSKKQIIYSLAGLILALLAYTIVVIITRLDIGTDEEDSPPAQTQEEQEEVTEETI